MALNRTTQPTRPGFISDVAVTGGDMLRGGTKTGLKTFGITLLGGLAVLSVGVAAVIAAGTLFSVGGVLGGIGALLGLGITGSSLSLGGIGFGLGALLGPSDARDRRVASGLEVAPTNQPDLQAQIAQQKAYNRQLQGTYGALSNASAAAAPSASLQTQSQAVGYNPQLKNMYGKIAGDVAANGQALSEPSAAMFPAGLAAETPALNTHVARMNERSNAAAADPTTHSL